MVLDTLVSLKNVTICTRFVVVVGGDLFLCVFMYLSLSLYLSSADLVHLLYLSTDHSLNILYSNVRDLLPMYRILCVMFTVHDILPIGYAFLLFQDERSVQALIEACIKEEDKLYLCVSSPTIKDKPVSFLSCALTYVCVFVRGKNYYHPVTRLKRERKRVWYDFAHCDVVVCKKPGARLQP